MGGKKQSAALNSEISIPLVAGGSGSAASNYPPHKITNVDRATCEDGHRAQRNQSKTTDMSVSQKSNHGKQSNVGLGSKSGLGGTHRHSLEKLKEYESQLLQNSAANPSLNVKTNRESAFEAQQ